MCRRCTQASAASALTKHYWVVMGSRTTEAAWPGAEAATPSAVETARRMSAAWPLTESTALLHEGGFVGLGALARRLPVVLPARAQRKRQKVGELRECGVRSRSAFPGMQFRPALRRALPDSASARGLVSSSAECACRARGEQSLASRGGGATALPRPEPSPVDGLTAGCCRRARRRTPPGRSGRGGC
eukprot:355021-Chlamydomonas_euryale.AAC.1